MNLNTIEFGQPSLHYGSGELGDKMPIITPPPSVSGDVPATGKTIEKPAKVIAEKLEEKKRRRKKKWKKPKDKPSRPLSAYNLFFQSERALMLGADAPTPALESLKKRVHCKTHGKIGFAEMARIIGGKWKSLEPHKKKVFEDKAKILKEKYAKELDLWREAQKERPSDSEANGLDAIATAAMASDPISSASSSPLREPTPSDSMRFLMADHHRNVLGSQGISYLRSFQNRQTDHAAFLGLSSLDTSLLKYPSAAEASANAILHHFQGMQSSGGSPIHTSRQAQLFEVERLSQLANPSFPSNLATMRRLQQGYMQGSFGLHI